MMKRLMDFSIAAIGLVTLAPILLGVALAIRLDSPGPVIFRQVRVGRYERTFQIFKFRSMRSTALESAPGMQVTVGADPRITKVGRFIRATKLDELPQLFNVLRGDMSLVGPRPEVPRYVALYPAEARREIFRLRPGITDEAAIEFANESDVLAKAQDPERAYVEEILPQKISLYLKYSRRHSVRGDLLIILRTLGRIASGR